MLARLILVLAALTGPAAASERVFADTCREHESDDTAGTIVVTLRDAKPLVALEWTDGALHGPVAASTVRRDGGRLAFTVETPDGTFTFAGRLGRHRLSGVLHEPWGAGQHVVLSERSREAAENPAFCR